MTLPAHSPQLVELYVDFAAHMLAIPEVTSIRGAARWLAERVLFGLPDPLAHGRRSSSWYHRGGDVAMALREFTYPDTRWHTDTDFVRYMRYANYSLVRGGAPPFVRMSEIDKWGKQLL